MMIDRLEELFKDIWKGMCDVQLIYPNAWVWNVTPVWWDKTYKWDTVYDALMDFHENYEKDFMQREIDKKKLDV